MDEMKELTFLVEGGLTATRKHPHFQVDGGWMAIRPHRKYPALTKENLDAKWHRYFDWLNGASIPEYEPVDLRVSLDEIEF